jgi:D-psicose/D-tagatose/L-ribulose 3-epimerase
MSVAPMQLGVSTWVWTSPATTEVLETLLPHIATLGFDVIELPIEEVGQFDVRRAGELAREHGLGVSVCAVIGPDRDLLLAGEAERERDVDEIASVLRGLGGYAADHGVVLGVETLNRFETSFLNTTAQALELLDRVDHPAVGVALDLFHLGIEEKHVGDALRAAGRRLVHLQVAENDRGTPGTGSLPWDDVAKALREIDYRGRVVIETFSDRVEAIARAAAIWRPLAPDSDSLAREGLAFLRPLLAPQATHAVH